MKLTSAIQESLVALLLYDDTPGGAKVVSGMIPAAQYDAFYRDIAAEGVAYLDKYGKCAGEHALDLIDTLKARRPEDAPVYDRIYASLEITKGSINRDYVLSQAGAFAEHQRIRSSLVRAVEALQANTPESVAETRRIMTDGLTSSFEMFDPGITFSDTARSLRFLDREDIVCFPTGIKELDRRELGPGRKKLHVFAGSTGAGKSWWLAHLAKMALMSRSKVLFITLEMSADEVMGRLCQTFFAMTKREGEVKTQTFKHDANGVFSGFEETLIADRPAYNQKDIKQILTPKVQSFARRPKLLIKEFPSGQLTIRALKAYLSSLEGSESFIPDIILLDYADLFDINPANKRLELDKIYVDLRGIAVERNVAMATASQTNAEGGQARVATKFHAAEAKSKVNHADVFITYNQTQDEFELGLARLFVAKGRGDADKFSVLLSQAYAMGQFAIESTAMSKTYWENFDKDLDKDDDDDS